MRSEHLFQKYLFRCNFHSPLQALLEIKRECELSLSFLLSSQSCSQNPVTDLRWRSHYKRFLADNYFKKNATSYMFDRIRNMLLLHVVIKRRSLSSSLKVFCRLTG